MIKFIKRFAHDIKKYRHYIAFSVKSNLKAELSNTILGYIWWVLDPLLHMLVYTFLVTVIFKRDIPAFPVYVFSALLPWKVATSLMTQSTKIIKQNSGIIKQVYLPKFLLPLSIAFTNSIKLIFGLVILFAMFFIFNVTFSWHIIEFIPIFFVFFFFYYSFSLFLTHIGTFFQDLSHLISYLLMFWFFVSPGVWTLDLVPERFRELMWLNPNITFFDSFRNVLMYDSHPHYAMLGCWFLVSCLLFITGISILYSGDKNYSKVI